MSSITPQNLRSVTPKCSTELNSVAKTLRLFGTHGETIVVKGEESLRLIDMRHLNLSHSKIA